MVKVDSEIVITNSTILGYSCVALYWYIYVNYYWESIND
jgi:hypothetical protein